MNIVPIKKPISGLAAELRSLADKVDSGAVTHAVFSWVEDGCYCFDYAASLNDCLILSALLHQNCIDRMRR